MYLLISYLQNHNYKTYSAVFIMNISYERFILTDMILEPNWIHAERRTQVQNVRVFTFQQMWYAVFGTKIVIYEQVCNMYHFECSFYTL